MSKNTRKNVSYLRGLAKGVGATRGSDSAHLCVAIHFICFKELNETIKNKDHTISKRPKHEAAPKGRVQKIVEYREALRRNHIDNLQCKMWSSIRKTLCLLFILFFTFSYFLQKSRKSNPLYFFFYLPGS